MERNRLELPIWAEYRLSFADRHPEKEVPVEHISMSIEDGIAVITLDRPDKLNAFTTTMENELIEAFDSTDANDAVRAVILTGAGRAFCAGADLSSGAETFSEWSAESNGTDADGDDLRRDGDDLRRDGDDLRRDGGGRVVLRMFDSLKPIIAAINGPAVGVGITMTLAADFRLAADDAGWVSSSIGEDSCPSRVRRGCCRNWFRSSEPSTGSTPDGSSLLRKHFRPGWSTDCIRAKIFQGRRRRSRIA